MSDDPWACIGSGSGGGGGGGGGTSSNPKKLTDCFNNADASNSAAVISLPLATGIWQTWCSGNTSAGSQYAACMEQAFNFTGNRTALGGKYGFCNLYWGP